MQKILQKFVQSLAEILEGSLACIMTSQASIVSAGLLDPASNCVCVFSVFRPDESKFKAIANPNHESNNIPAIHEVSKIRGRQQLLMVVREYLSQ